MRIVVVQHAGTDFYTQYLSSLMEDAAVQAGYQLAIFSNSIPVSRQPVANNAVIFVSINAVSRFMLSWWYKYRLPSVVKKLEAAAVLDLNGIGMLKNTPVIAVINQQKIIDKKTKLTILQKFAAEKMPQSITSAKTIVTRSHTLEKIVYADADKKNSTVIKCTAPGNFRKYEWHEKIMTKSIHADNNEYFFSVLNDEDDAGFVLLLRAFSRFKKWQQSSMKLVLLPEEEAFSPQISSRLSNYKYRADVTLLKQLDERELSAVFASAHSLVHVFKNNPDLVVLAIALKCALPVITLSTSETKEYLGGAALYVHNDTEEAFGDALVQLYKDENLQAQLRQEAGKESEKLNRGNYQNTLWQTIITAAQEKNQL